MNYHPYYSTGPAIPAPQEKSPMYAGGSLGSSLGSLGYPQQGALHTGAPSMSGMPSSLGHSQAAAYNSAMQAQTFTPTTFAQSPYGPPQAATYQHAGLAYPQATMAAQNSAAAYMAAAAGGQSGPYGGVRLASTTAGYPGTPSAAVYGFPGSQPMYASSQVPGHPSMHPSMAQHLSSYASSSQGGPTYAPAGLGHTSFSGPSPHFTRPHP